VFRDIHVQDVVGEGRQPGCSRGWRKPPAEHPISNVKITANIGCGATAPGIDLSDSAFAWSEGQAFIELNEPTRH